uniref:Iron-siderophore ABC transporter substrate-binding protein n=1 Tax=Oscillatoriales cyanobacterium SpSt-418 TaxID=2282169 RepID=A0A7C3KDL2_9CYAN
MINKLGLIRRYPCRWVALAMMTVLLVVGCHRYDHHPVSSGWISPNCRVILHDAGKSCVPLNPSRVVAIGTLEELLALDIKPVGAAFWVAGGGSGDIPAYLGDRAAGITNLGNTSQPNLERIIQLKPDLIIGVPHGIKPIHKLLSQIAPTVVLDGADPEWKAFFVRVADVLNRSQQAKQLLDTYEQRLAEFQSQIGRSESHADGQPKQMRVSVIRSYSNGLRIYMRESFNGSILKDAGLLRPPAQDKDTWAKDVSLESIPEMEGDVIFVTHDDPKDSLLNQISDQPLWHYLEAVQHNKVYTVDLEYWIGGSSIIAANRVLDDLFKYLVPQSFDAAS